MSLKEVYSSHLGGKYDNKGYSNNDSTPDYNFNRADRFNLKIK